MKYFISAISSFILVQNLWAYPLPANTIKSYQCPECAQLSHDTLEDSWELKPTPVTSNITNRQRSVSFKKSVPFSQLKTGVSLGYLSAGAVVRITPQQTASIPLIKIKTPALALMTLQEATQDYESSSELGEFQTDNHMIFQLKPQLGSGVYVLKSDDSHFKDKDIFIINVYDAYSLYGLYIETNALHYQYGDTLNVTVTLDNPEIPSEIEELTLDLISPQGISQELSLNKVNSDTYTASLTLISETNDKGENWYLEAMASTHIDDYPAWRSAHTAFSYAIPSATLESLDRVSKDSLDFKISLDVATASRYVLQTILFHKNEKGEIIPVATTHKGQWLDTGKQNMTIHFENKMHYSEDNLYIGTFTLIDYGQLKPVYRYASNIKVTDLKIKTL